MNLIRVKDCLESLDGKRVPISAELRKKGNYPYYGATGIVDYIDNYLFSGNHLLVGEDGAPFDNAMKEVAFIASGDFWVNNHAHILKPLDGFNIDYLKYAMNSVDYMSIVGGSTRLKLTKSDLMDIEIHVPNENQQEKIANKLKEKEELVKAKIDNLTQKLHHLEEYKTALIHNAVTKGLNANGGAIVDSIDIKEVTRLKSVCNISTGSKDTQDSVDDGKYDFYVRSQNKKKINSYTHDCDAVLTAGDGDVGKVFHCVSGKFSAHQRVYVLTDFKEVLPKFIYYSMRNGFYDHVKARSQDVTVASLRMPMLESFNISLFSLDNQELIVRYLDMYLRIIQNSKDAINKKITLLLEYKKSLINEAVSGK